MAFALASRKAVSVVCQAKKATKAVSKSASAGTVFYGPERAKWLGEWCFDDRVLPPGLPGSAPAPLPSPLAEY
jgi:hypothetical protein